MHNLKIDTVHIDASHAKYSFASGSIEAHEFLGGEKALRGGAELSRSFERFSEHCDEDFSERVQSWLGILYGDKVTGIYGEGEPMFLDFSWENYTPVEGLGEIVLFCCDDGEFAILGNGDVYELPEGIEGHYPTESVSAYVENFPDFQEDFASDLKATHLGGLPWVVATEHASTADLRENLGADATGPLPDCVCFFQTNTNHYRAFAWKGGTLGEVFLSQY